MILLPVDLPLGRDLGGGNGKGLGTGGAERGCSDGLASFMTRKTGLQKFFRLEIRSTNSGIQVWSLLSGAFQMEGFHHGRELRGAKLTGQIGAHKVHGLLGQAALEFLCWRFEKAQRPVGKSGSLFVEYVLELRAIVEISGILSPFVAS